MNKNIYIIPTEKPSRLYKFANEFYLDTIPKDYYKKFNIYITSDEEIKEGDWWYNIVNNEFGKSYFKNSIPAEWGETKKIILTTDLDLIADGVRVIDDEFLEWFVKNPSCERVETVIEKMFPMYESFPESINKPPFYGNLKYEIIIPQEKDISLNGGAEITFPSSIIFKVNPKQETLEKAADMYVKADLKKTPMYWMFHETFIEGAKWQAERMYSEEEVLEILNKRVFDLKHKKDTKTTKEWFEQFKKK
jgi:hypothetical protein